VWGNVKRHGKDGEIKRTRGSNLVCAVAENVFGGRELTGVAVAKVGFSRLFALRGTNVESLPGLRTFPQRQAKQTRTSF
jgi:hypothetical protein